MHKIIAIAADWKHLVTPYPPGLQRMSAHVSPLNWVILHKKVPELFGGKDFKIIVMASSNSDVIIGMVEEVGLDVSIKFGDYKPDRFLVIHGSKMFLPIRPTRIR